ncbi:stage III sporulation protein AH [Virgibacillus subterraneus]|uniref:Stage III sporulation protein AH n=2 Tax=Virgibacillus TaxID=84406 RepID=A0A1H1BHV7_9BACI|nr:MULTISPECIES: SpoIIIAH-like family protein [Virgibacillus]SDQ51443.1 stage III sporulation protein AH [Virgibacillus salinus]SEQ20396.1 stage III sporulation protein AH [Virgibacillus subterraneus]
MLKKQTVWLLTMLSLMIVLSVYYITSPDSGDLAYLPEGDDSSEEASSPDSSASDASNTDADVDDISNLGQDQFFTTLRMEVQNERSAEKDRLDDVVASSSASIQEKNEARDQINQIESISSKEIILEESIVASADYNDVLVRHDEDKVHVHVKADQLNKTEVVNIMQMVKDEFGEITVDVNVQPTES